MKATLAQIATYIERDGATVRCHADGSQTVTVPLTGAGHLTYEIAAEQVDDLNRARDDAYRAVAAKRRAARAAR